MLPSGGVHDTVASASFSEPRELKLGESESAKISTMRSVDVGQKIIAAVKSNPFDPQAPESLYLVLRMIRYGCNPMKEPSIQLDFSLSDLNPDLHTGEHS